MKIKLITTIDYELNFEDCDVYCKNKKELDLKIKTSSVIKIKEKDEIYYLNAGYILFYKFK